MPAKKKYILIAGFFMLTAVALVILLLGNNSAYGKKEAQFSIRKPEKIDRMAFSREGEEEIFEKKDGLWQQLGNYEVSQEAADLFLRCLSDIEVKSPVNESYIANCCPDTKPVEVSLYRGRWKVRSFLVYPTTENAYGNVLRKKAGTKPFITWVPWYRGQDLSDILQMDPSFWRPDLLFAFHPTDIRKLKLSWPGKANFTILNTKNGTFSFTAEGGEDRRIDTAAIGRYLTYFRYVPVHNWGLEKQQEAGLFYHTDSLLCHLALHTKNDSVEVSFYPLYRESESGLVKDMDRLAAQVYKKGYREPACLRYYDVDPVLKDAAYFLKR